MDRGTSAYAQCAAKNDAIQPGERLTYELKFNWKFIWINAGEAKMDLTPVTYQGKVVLSNELIGGEQQDHRHVFQDA